MRSARLGDDNQRDDPTVHELERLAAKITGHEAALFCPTGTMANLLGVRMYSKPGDGVVMPTQLNMHRYGVVAWSGVQPLLVETESGYPDISALVDMIDWGLVSGFPPALVVLELPHNNGGGMVISPDYLAEVREVAHSKGLAFYLDGARIFNAAVAARRSASDFAAQADAAMFCLSKGLSAPVGSVLCGSRDAIEWATRTRFLMGGAMRQAGLLAACGIYALNNLVDRLVEDHANARLLAQAAERWSPIVVDQPSVDTNMVYLTVAQTGMTAAQFCEQLAEHGVLAGAVDPMRVRCVTHRGITAQDIEVTIKVIDRILTVID